MTWFPTKRVYLNIVTRPSALPTYLYIVIILVIYVALSFFAVLYTLRWKGKRDSTTCNVQLPSNIPLPHLFLMYENGMVTLQCLFIFTVNESPHVL